MNQPKFRFLTEKFVKQNYIQITTFQSATLREKLPRGIYWIQLLKSILSQRLEFSGLKPENLQEVLWVAVLKNLFSSRKSKLLFT